MPPGVAGCAFCEILSWHLGAVLGIVENSIERLRYHHQQPNIRDTADLYSHSNYIHQTHRPVSASNSIQQRRHASDSLQLESYRYFYPTFSKGREPHQQLPCAASIPHNCIMQQGGHHCMPSNQSLQNAISNRLHVPKNGKRRSDLKTVTSKERMPSFCRFSGHRRIACSMSFCQLFHRKVEGLQQYVSARAFLAGIGSTDPTGQGG